MPRNAARKGAADNSGGVKNSDPRHAAREGAANNAVRLTRNFLLDEFTRSEIAARRGREIVVAEDSPEFRSLLCLCETVLQPLREGLGPVHISSGLRPLWLNELVGGSRTSQHCRGEAADIVVTGHSPLEVCNWIEAQQLGFDQLIHEFGRWTHVSIRLLEGQRRGQALTAQHRDGRTVYSNGLSEVA